LLKTAPQKEGYGNSFSLAAFNFIFWLKTAPQKEGYGNTSEKKVCFGSIC